MKKFKLTPAVQRAFLDALAETGSVTKAVAIAGASRTRVYALRKADSEFANAWDQAEEMAADLLLDEARRRALEGVPVPLVSAGKVVHGDDGQPIIIQHYSDRLLITLIEAHRQRHERLELPSLQSAGDPLAFMAWLTTTIRMGKITPSDAAKLANLVKIYVEAIEMKEFDQRLLAVESQER
jgi:hypothetical protein